MNYLMIAFVHETRSCSFLWNRNFVYTCIYNLADVMHMHMFRAFYQSAQFINWPAQFINWPAQSRNYRLGAQFINRVRNLEIESRASNERSVHVLYIA